jgi:hypothetical protein
MRNVPSLRFPQWQESFLNAVTQTNHENLNRNIVEAVEAIIRER